MDADVAVIGGGIVGLATAWRYGVRHPGAKRIRERALANGVACERIGPERLRELEPHAAGGGALHVPETGIVDFVAVCRKLAELIRAGGGAVWTRADARRVRAGGPRVIVETTAGDVSARWLVNCAGLHSDRVLQRAGRRRPARIVPFRGEYYELAAEARGLCRNLIYPVPDPSFPFLGVHFTRSIHGGVECGPNAVLALAREGYTWSRIDPRDVWDVVSYPAFWRLAARHWRTGGAELVRSLSRAAFTRSLQRLVPAVEERHLSRAPAGVRAQALAPDGQLVDDFLIQAGDGMVHVCNAPSPAATSALAIGEHVVDRLDAMAA